MFEQLWAEKHGITNPHRFTDTPSVIPESELKSWEMMPEHCREYRIWVPLTVYSDGNGHYTLYRCIDGDSSQLGKFKRLTRCNSGDVEVDDLDYMAAVQWYYMKR